MTRHEGAAERFRLAREWAWDAGMAGFHADAFAHWVADYYARTGELPAPTFSACKGLADYSPTARTYYHLHGSRETGPHTPTWRYGEPVPVWPSSYVYHAAIPSGL